MKHAVIQSGGKQYLVEKGQELDIELIAHSTGSGSTKAKKQLEFDPLLVFDEKSARVGTPHVSGAKVSAEVVEPVVKGKKVTITKFKAKKRENTVTGHRQKYSRIKVTAIS